MRQSCPYFPGSIWHNKAEEHAITITIDSKHWALGECCESRSHNTHQSLNERALSENWNYVMISVCGVRVVARAGEGGDSTAGSVFSVVSRRLDRRRLARRGCRHPAVTLYHLQPGRCPAHHHTTPPPACASVEHSPGQGLACWWWWWWRVKVVQCFPVKNAARHQAAAPVHHVATTPLQAASVLAPIDPEYGNYYPGSQ